MGRARTFDWDEAARLRAAGWTIRALAARYEKSYHGIRYALDAEFRRRNQESKAEWQRGGTCPDCGAPSTRRSRDEPSRCRSCSAKLSRAVRGDEVWCPGCVAWLPRSEFTRSSNGRGVRGICRACDTARHRAYRETHPDVTAAENMRRNARRRARMAAQL